MTQLQAARKGVITEAMKIVAANEKVDAKAVCAALASGEAVIPLNIHHALSSIYIYTIHSTF